MKKTLYLFAVLAITGTLFISSCQKDDPVIIPPSINFVAGADYISSDVTLLTNQEFRVGINANKDSESDNKMINFKVIRTFNNIPYTALDSTINGDYFSIELIANSNPFVGEERWTFTITDEAGETSEVSFVITTEAGIQAFLDITLGSYNDEVYGSFFNTTSGEVFFKPEATTNQDVIDFIFFLGATNGATIAAPDNQDAINVFALDWTTQNQTRFMTTGISVAEFDAIGASYNFTDFTGTDDNWNQLADDDIVYFKTAGDKLGFFKVNSINAKGDIINIDVKVQK
ncbi:MAG: hypothetical protein K8R41_09585 [Bacteroidales bacterium]|nr:hypothetical protein [Bacteroidales bacterium]